MEDWPNDATGDVLRRLVKSGSNLSRPMSFEFHLSALSKLVGARIAEKAANLGFSTEVWRMNGEWRCTCKATILASYDEITRIENQLDELAGEYGCACVGFGSFGNSEKKGESGA